MPREYFERFEADPNTFMEQYVTVCETWVHQLKAKQQSKQWRHMG